MAESVLLSTIRTIEDLLCQESIYLRGINDQVICLQSDLSRLLSFLRDADSRKSESEVLRIWVSQVRELAYDAEDVLETFALKIGSKRESGFSNIVKRSACFLIEECVLFKTRSKIEMIASRIVDLVKKLQTYGVRELMEEGSSSRSRLLRRTYPHIIEDNIVGLDDDIEKLVSILVEEESPYRVASICGMGGLGKTTLAKKVYQHSRIRGHFNHFAWVYVSQNYIRREVWECILSGVSSSNERGSKFSDEELVKNLFNFLKDNKCLLVLDDIWSCETWDSLKAAFPREKYNSKILLTTRNEDVASYSSAYVLELRCLNEEESWELFQKIAFPMGDSLDCGVDPKKKELGKSMVKQCSGLPLAILVLGGILATKNSLTEWENVFENVGSYLKRGRIIENVLALSYDNLPPYLKPCFLYLSHFPKDYEIHAERLIQLWVAEGIVSSNQEEGNGGEIAEYVAEQYLIELAERCMIQVREIATFKIKTFHMNDLMRNVCLSKAKEENFLSIMDESNVYCHSSTTHRVHRVAAHNHFEVQRIKSPCLRSLLIFDNFFHAESLISSFVSLSMLKNYFENHEDDDCNPLLWVVVLLGICLELHKMGGTWTYMLNNFQLLRVLDHEGGIGVAGCKLPSDISNLINLRFLSLKDLRFVSSKLPSALGNLRCLQTLDLRVECKSTSIHVPNVIWKMKQLRHLYLPERCKRKTKLKLGTLRKLQTLVNFSTRNCYVEDLLNMTFLSKLKILLPFMIKDFKEDLEMNPPIFTSKNLLSLSIESTDYHQIDARHLAHLLSSCNDIAYIHLSGSNLNEDSIPTLGKLPMLGVLELHNEAFTGKGMVCSAQCFLKLDSLSLNELQNLEEWKVDKGAMPHLRYLKIHDCKNLKTLPDGLRFITTLQELRIEWMPKAFKDKFVKGGEDFYKVQNVHSIIFQNCHR